MSILSLCDNGDVLSVFRIVNIVIMIIKIAVPILLIVIGMITLMKTINVGNDDLLVKAKKQLVNNCIAAIVIFLIPTLVNVIVKISDTNNQYRDCLYADSEIINDAYSNKAETLVSIAESSKTYNDYYAAKDAVTKIKDGNERASLEERLDALYEIIKSDIDKNNDEVYIKLYYPDLVEYSEKTITIPRTITGIAENIKLTVEGMKSPGRNYQYNLSIHVRNKKTKAVFGRVEIRGINISKEADSIHVVQETYERL